MTMAVILLITILIMMITEATVILVSIDPSMAGRVGHELSGGTKALQRPQQHRTSRKVPRQRAASFAPVFYGFWEVTRVWM